MKKEKTKKGIDRKSLRIGNTIQTIRGLMLNVQEVKMFTCNCSIQGIREGETNYYNDYNYQGLQPVELTEELLLRLGFEKVENKETYFIQVGEYELYVTVNGFSGTLEKPQSWFCSVSTGYGSQPVTVIKNYLHELQNLYHELTGKELELKPKK